MTDECKENGQPPTANCKLFTATAHNADDNIETSLMFFFYAEPAFMD